MIMVYGIQIIFAFEKGCKLLYICECDKNQ